MKQQQSSASIARLEARLPIGIMTRLKRAAQIQGRSVSAFVISAADEAACRTIQQTEIIDLCLADQRQLAEAIMNPPEPTAAFKLAAKRYRRLTGRK